MRKQVLQKHQINSMLKAIQQMEQTLTQEAKFCKDYSKVYKIRDRVVHGKLVDLNKWVKAANVIKEITKANYAHKIGHQTNGARVIKIAPLRSTTETAA